MTQVSMKQLLESGVHFGHQTRRWNPKMDRYIFTERNGIYIIDLQQTVKLIDKSYAFVRELAQNGENILFVGTKKQAQDSIADEAKRAGQYYVNHRWLGGTLTNWDTIKTRIQRLKEIEVMSEDGTFDVLPKKEVGLLKKELEKLERNIGGIKDMPGIPSALFVVDPKKEYIAINEAHKLNIPIIAMVDTNCDPDEVDYVIPSNDDAIRAVKLITQTMAEAYIEGSQSNEEFEEVAEETASTENSKSEETENVSTESLEDLTEIVEGNN